MIATTSTANDHFSFDLDPETRPSRLTRLTCCAHELNIFKYLYRLIAFTYIYTALRTSAHPAPTSNTILRSRVPTRLYNMYNIVSLLPVFCTNPHLESTHVALSLLYKFFFFSSTTNSACTLLIWFSFIGKGRGTRDPTCDIHRPDGGADSSQREGYLPNV